jgi:catechol 2,3-dioxygenase-like lactoylglutathione lyase family enzyme
MTDETTLHAQCLCGAIALRVRTTALSPIQVCHCSTCRRAQGGPFATNIPTDASGVEFVRGKEHLKGYESSPGKTRWFCPTCGSPIYSTKDTLPDVLRLRAGLFTEPLPVRPAFHAYVDSGANWWPLNDDLPQFPEGSDAKALREVQARTTVDVTGIDHIYVAVTDMARAEVFYDRVMLSVLSHRKNTFSIHGDPHIQYYNRHFGFVLRPARSDRTHDSYSAGLHHFCLRVESIEDVQRAAKALAAQGIAATPAEHYPQYADDYWATFFNDPDGIRLEITNYRQGRRQRHDRWYQLGTPT